MQLVLAINQFENSEEQECISVGCVPPALCCTEGLCLGGLPLPWTNTSENIALPQTLFAGGNNSTPCIRASLLAT